MYERNLGVKLSLVADFARAAKDAASNIELIQKSLDSLKKEAGGGFSVSGIKDLAAELNGLGKAAAAASASAKRVGDETASSGTKARKAAQDVRAAAEAVNSMGREAATAATQILRLSTAMTNLGNAVLSVNRMGDIFTPIQSSALSAMREVNRLDAEIRRLPTSKTVRIMIETVRVNLNEQKALPVSAPGVNWRASESPVQSAIGQNNYRALPWGSDSRYGPIPQPASRTAYSTGDQTAFPSRSSQPYMLGGQVDPNFDASEWYRQNAAYQQRMASGWQPPPPPDDTGTPWGNGSGGGGGGRWNLGSSGIMGAGDRIRRTGDQIQGTGMASLVNAGLIASVLTPLAVKVINIEDLKAQAGEPMSHAGVSQENQQKFMDFIASFSENVGGGYEKNIAGAYPFFSSLPTYQAHLNANDPNQMKDIKSAYGSVMTLAFADNSSKTPVDASTMSLLVAASARNLGLPMGNSKQVASSYETAANYLALIKNKTASTAEGAGSALRNIGPVGIQAGLTADEIAGALSILFENKILGGPAGNQLKRIVSRQSMDPKAVRDLQQLVTKLSGGKENLSMYNKDGSTKSFFDFLGEIGKFESEHKLSTQAREKIAGTLSGPYAAPGMATLIDFAAKNGGKKGLDDYARKTFHTLPDDRKPGEDANAYTARKRSEGIDGKGNLETEFSKTNSALLKAFGDTVKAMTPDIILLLKSVNGMIQAFDNLPEPMKRIAGDGVLAFLALSAISGISLVLVGNIIKLGGGFLSAVGWILKMIEAANGLKILSGIGPLWMQAAGAIGRFGGVLLSLIPRAAVAASLAIRGLFLAMGPVGWVITAITLAVGLFALAWSKDFGGIREKTEAAGKFIVGMIQNISYTLAKWGVSGQKYAEMFIQGIIGKFEGGVTLVKNALKKIGDLFPHSEPKDSSSPLYGQTASGQAYSDMFINGAILALGAGSGKVKKAAKPLADVFMVLKNESVAQVESMAKQIEDSLTKAGVAIKKRLIDLIDPKTHQISKVFGDPRAFRIAMGTKDNSAVQDAHDMAIKNLDDWKKNPALLTPASLAGLLKAIRGFETKAATAKAVAEIEHMASTIELYANKADVKIAAALKKTQDTFYGPQGDPTNGPRGGDFGEIQTKFNSEDRSESTFDKRDDQYSTKLQNQIRMRKDQEVPTAKELNDELATELTLRRELGDIYDQEESQRSAIVQLMTQTQAEIDKVNTSTQAGRDQQAQLNAQMGDYRSLLLDLNNRLTSQKITIDGIDKSIVKYNEDITAATNGSQKWGQEITKALDDATKSASKALADGAGGAVDKFIERLLGQVGKKKEGPIKQAIGDFLGTFIKSMTDSIFQQMMGSITSGLTSFLQNILGGSSSGGILGAFGGLIGGLGSSNVSKSTSIGALQNGFNSSNSGSHTANSSDTQGVVIYPETGSTDLGQQIADNISQVAASTKTADTPSSGQIGGINVPANTKGGIAGGITLGGQDAIGASGLTGLQGDISGALGAVAAYQSLSAVGKGQQGGSQGNIASAVQASAGIMSLGQIFTGGAAAALGPYIAGLAAAAGLYTMFGGPHWGPASNYPDRSDTQNYGQFVSNINGAPGNFNGSYILPQTQYDTSAGNQDLAQQIASFVDSSSALNGLTTAQQQTVEQLKALGGPNGQLGIASEKNGVFTLQSGQTVGVQTYEALISAAETIQSNYANNQLQQQENANALASSFTSLMLNGPANFQIPGFLGGTVGGSNFGWGAAQNFLNTGVTGIGGSSTRGLLPGNQQALSGGNLGVPGGGGTPSTAPTLVVQILPNAQIGDTTDIGSAINDAIPALVNAVNQANYNNYRLVGNYQSATT